MDGSSSNPATGPNIGVQGTTTIGTIGQMVMSPSSGPQGPQARLVTTPQLASAGVTNVVMSPSSSSSSDASTSDIKPLGQPDWRATACSIGLDLDEQSLQDVYNINNNNNNTINNLESANGLYQNSDFADIKTEISMNPMQNQVVSQNSTNPDLNQSVSALLDSLNTLSDLDQQHDSMELAMTSETSS